MIFNDRRKGLSLVNQANDSNIMGKNNKQKDPFDLRNSPKKLRKNISKVSMEGAHGIKPKQLSQKDPW
jgi:hypothetical protein